MATRTLGPGRTPRRAFFGALDADGWSWASLKAFFWFILIIILLGYIPDRAYYFTVGSTVEVDAPILLWSPVNLCPSQNSGLPCPAPIGAVVPWQGEPTSNALPAGRTGGTALQLGSHIVYIGGSDGSAPAATTFVANLKNGVFDAWTQGPVLPEARSDAAAVTLNGSAYLIGGNGPDGKPTNTIWVLPTASDTGAIGAWAPVKNLTLPDARSGAAALAVTDGILVVGGRGADGAPSGVVWKSTVDSKGVLGSFVEQAPLIDPVADAGSALVGEYVWVYGGTDPKGPTGAVQRGHFGVPGSDVGASASGAVATPAPSTAPGASAAPQSLGVQRWAVLNSANLPAARTGGAGFSANGAMYLVGGSDGTAQKSELYWAIPDSAGSLSDGWHHLPNDDLPPGGLAGSSPVVSGSTVILVGGTSQVGVLASSIEASLAPQPPFFQLGLFGVVIPALQIPGEIGQQLGYLAAAGVGTVNFAILIFVGWAFNHRETVKAWVDRRRKRS
jgi:hypothetical protein